MPVQIYGFGGHIKKDLQDGDLLNISSMAAPSGRVSKLLMCAFVVLTVVLSESKNNKDEREQ